MSENSEFPGEPTPENVPDPAPAADESATPPPPPPPPAPVAPVAPETPAAYEAAPPPAPAYAAAPAAGQAKPSDAFAIASLVLGIVSLVFSWCCVGFTGIAAIVFGVLALNKVKAGTGGRRGFALAGIILGAIAVVVYIIFIIIGVSSNIGSIGK